MKPEAIYRYISMAFSILNSNCLYRKQIFNLKIPSKYNVCALGAGGTFYPPPGGELVVEHSSTNPRSPVRFQVWSHTGVMDYDESCFVHLTPGVVHNFPKAVGV